MMSGPLDNLDHQLRELIRGLGLPLRNVAKALDISASECWEWWMGRAPLPKYSKLNNLRSEWKLCLETLAKGEVDLLSVKIHAFGPPDVLPERYSINALSFVSSSRHILEVIKMQFGTHAVNYMLLQFGINPNYFEDINNRISLLFFEDALDYFLNLGYKWRDFDWLSKALFLTVEETSLKKIFPRSGSYDEAYERIRFSTDHFDRNFDYDFSISATGMNLKCKPSEELVEALKRPNYGSQNLYKYRAYLFGNMVDLCGLDPLPVQTVRCISQGSKLCEYDIKFPKTALLELRHF